MSQLNSATSIKKHFATNTCTLKKNNYQYTRVVDF